MRRYHKVTNQYIQPASHTSIPYKMAYVAFQIYGSEVLEIRKTKNSIPRFERIEVNEHGKNSIYHRERTGNVLQSD